MALWKENTPATPTAAPPQKDLQVPPPKEAAPAAVALNPEQRRKEQRPEQRESVISADLTIEGKIEGSGHVRIAGRFKGDVNVDGNLTIESGAHVTGQVRAKTVIISGELHGNIEGAQRVELLESGVLAGDVKAGSLTVSAGSRMRGQVEFGWEEKSARSFAAN